MRAHVSGHNRGIALLEVLIALAVMGLGLTAALKAIGTCTRGESRATKDALLWRLSEQQLALLRSEGRGLTPGERRGRFAPPLDRYSWVARTEYHTGTSSFRLVGLSIYDDASPRHPVFVTQSLL